MIAKIYAEKPANIRNPTYNGRKIVDNILTNLSIQLLHFEKMSIVYVFFLSNEKRTVYLHITQIKTTTD